MLHQECSLPHALMNQESSIRESITLPKVDDQGVDPMVDLNVVDDGDAAILEDVGLVVASLEAVTSNIINTTRWTIRCLRLWGWGWAWSIPVWLWV